MGNLIVRDSKCFNFFTKNRKYKYWAQWGSTWSEILIFFTPKLRRESRRAPRWSRPHQTKSPRAIGAHLRTRRDSCRADFGPILWRGRDGGMKERGRQFGNRFSNSGFLIAHRNFLTNKVKFTLRNSILKYEIRK